MVDLRPMIDPRLDSGARRSANLNRSTHWLPEDWRSGFHGGADFGVGEQTSPSPARAPHRGQENGIWSMSEPGPVVAQASARRGALNTRIRTCVLVPIVTGGRDPTWLRWARRVRDPRNPPQHPKSGSQSMAGIRALSANFQAVSERPRLRTSGRPLSIRRPTGQALP